MKESFQVTIVATTASLMVALLIVFPQGQADVFRWSSVALIPSAVVLLFGALRLALGQKVARRAYFGLLPLAFYLGLSISLTSLLADHYGQSRTKSIVDLLGAYPLEALFTFIIGTSVVFLGLSLLGLVGAGLARALSHLVRR